MRPASAFRGLCGEKTSVSTWSMSFWTATVTVT
jgi:hypothetical protein